MLVEQALSLRKQLLVDQVNTVLVLYIGLFYGCTDMYSNVRLNERLTKVVLRRLMLSK